MGGQNKKESITALHKENILSAAEKLFLEKGVTSTTIEDISKASEYSRRTIYTYYESKEEILYQIILKGLLSLKNDLTDITNGQAGFIEQYEAICRAMEKFQTNNPQSVDSITRMKMSDINIAAIPPVILTILQCGTEINNLLAGYIEQGKLDGFVRADVEPMKTVYIMWGSITSLLTLVQSKAEFLEKEFVCPKEEFLKYGYKQIINSILEERI